MIFFSTLLRSHAYQTAAERLFAVLDSYSVQYDFIENTRDIWPRAFVSCENLKFVSIPHSLTTIYSTAFGDCFSLTSVAIPDSVTEIADNVFKNCDRLTI